MRNQIYFADEELREVEKAIYDITISQGNQSPLHFDCVVKLIEKWNKEKIEELAYGTLKIFNNPEPPRGRDECKSCQELNKWFRDRVNII